MDWINRITVTNKFIIQTTILLISVLIAGLFTLYSIYKHSIINTDTQLLYKHNSNIINLKNNFNSFLIQTELSQTTDVQQITDWSISSEIDECNRFIEKIINSTLCKHYELDAVFRKIQEETKNLERNFKHLQKLKTEIGNTQSGFMYEIFIIEDKLSKTINDTETFSNLKSYFNDLKSYREEFNTTKKISSYNNFSNQQMVLAKEINKIHYLDVYGQYQKSKLIDYLAEYKNLFDVVVSKNIEIGLTANEGLWNTIGVALMDLQFEISDIIDKVQKKNIKDRYFRYTQIIIVFLSLLIVSGILTLLLTHSIRKPIIILKKNLRKLATGELEQTLLNQSKDEFAEMANNLNVLIQSLQNKADIIDKIGFGEIDNQINTLSNKDILGLSLKKLQDSLKESNLAQQKRRNEDDIQDWINIGLTQFADILRSNNDNIKKLSEEIINNLIIYIDANVGGLYIYNDENKEDIHLSLEASFAYDRFKYIQRKIKLTEGLIGTCAVEKNLLFFEKVPDDYIKITSGYGGAKPNCLIIVPLLLNQEVQGILEIASFKKIDKHVIDFLEKLSEDIATTIAYVKINTKTIWLLEESQKQAEKMLDKETELHSKIEQAEKKINELQKTNQKLNEKINSLQEEKIILNKHFNELKNKMLKSQ